MQSKTIIFDAFKNPIDYKNRFLRIVSLVPSQTELLCDLGLEHSLVGITKFCVHPTALRAQKTIVGGTKKVDFEKMKALNPDIILCNKEENTKEMVTELQKITTVHVSYVTDIAGSIALISDYAKLFRCRTEGAKIIQKIELQLKEFDAYIKDKPVLKVAYFIWRDPWMVAANHTFIQDILKRNKFKNIYDVRVGYPEVEIKKIRLEGDPDVVFLSSEPYPFKEEHAFELGRHTHHAKTVFVDGEFFSWYGSRLTKAFAYFKTIRERIDG